MSSSRYNGIFDLPRKPHSMMMMDEKNNGQVIDYQSFLSAPYPMNINDVLEDADAIVEAAEEILLSDPSVEPVPLGPQGVQSLVKELPLTAASGALLHEEHNQKNGLDFEAFFAALNPLVREGQQPGSVGSTTMPYYGSCEDLHTTKRKLEQLPHVSGASKKRRCSFQYPQGPVGGVHPSRTTSCSQKQQQRSQSDSCLTQLRGFQPTNQQHLVHEGNRFRSYQSGQWHDRYQDLIEFRNVHGHCLVPHNFPENQQLAQWIKRQRYQHKLKQMKRHTTLSDERQALLDNLGFVWDSHKIVWMERLESLKRFKARYGHCNVPSASADRSLAIWVKCQRRQCKLYQNGDSRSTMTKERFAELECLGFDWNPRNL